jgi:hypothetical protein
MLSYSLTQSNCGMRWPGTSTLPAGSAAAAGRRAAWTPRGPRLGQGTGIEAKDRGRVPADLVAKFKAATGQQG